MQRIEAFLSEDEVPDWASTLSCSSSNTPAATEGLGFHQAVFQWENPEDASSSRFRLGPLDLMFPSRGLTLVRGPTGSGKTALLSALLGGNHYTSICYILTFNDFPEMHCISGSVLINKTQHRIAYCGQNPCKHLLHLYPFALDSTYRARTCLYQR
jgi:ABC-type transport system involved in cytochrome bd biosynthesis fused ATPase/permease subunit